jgi:hypothetical protein
VRNSLASGPRGAGPNSAGARSIDCANRLGVGAYVLGVSWGSWEAARLGVLRGHSLDGSTPSRALNLVTTWTPAWSAWTAVWSAWIPVEIGGKYSFRRQFSARAEYRSRHVPCQGKGREFEPRLPLSHSVIRIRNGPASAEHRPRKTRREYVSRNS